MQKNIYSLLLVVGLMLVLPMSIAAVGSTNLDVDSQYVSCDMPITNSPSGVKGDTIAISTADGESCGIANSTATIYDIALQYRSGPGYGTAYAEKIDILGNSVMSFGPVPINQNSVLSKLVTTKFVQFSPNDIVLISNAGQGTVNVEGFVIRKHQ